MEVNQLVIIPRSGALASTLLISMTKFESRTKARRHLCTELWSREVARRVKTSSGIDMHAGKMGQDPRLPVEGLILLEPAINMGEVSIYFVGKPVGVINYWLRTCEAKLVV